MKSTTRGNLSFTTPPLTLASLGLPRTEWHLHAYHSICTISRRHVCRLILHALLKEESFREMSNYTGTDHIGDHMQSLGTRMTGATFGRKIPLGMHAPFRNQTR
jgi:hypothetical protein